MAPALLPIPGAVVDPASAPGRGWPIGLGVLMAAQAAAGLLWPSHYRDVDWIRATWFANDWVTLVAAVPLLLAGHAMATRGSLRGRLIWQGAIAYSIYNAAFYLFGASLNTFFPLYVATMTVGGATLAGALTGTNATVVAATFKPDTPVRLLGGTLSAVGAGLGAIWIAFWAAYVFTGRPTPIAPDAFQVIAAVDLTLVVPMLVTGGVLLMRRRPWGFVIASMASIQGALYLMVLSAGSAVLVHRGLADWPGELPLWGGLLIVMGLVAVTLLRCIAPMVTGPAGPKPPSPPARQLP